MTQTIYLYVSRDWNGDWSLDEKIEEIVGLERDGSGTGCGTRDLDFTLEKPLTDDQVRDLKKRIVAACPENLAIDVLYEEWARGTTDDPIRAFSA